MTNESALSDDPEEKPKGILVVEDEIMTRFTLAEWFRLEGYKVYEAANATDAVALLNSPIPIHVVISDIDMPGAMDGLQLFDYIKATAPQIRVILASGRERELAEREVTRFVKPYSLPKMAAHIAALLAPGSEKDRE